MTQLEQLADEATRIGATAPVVETVEAEAVNSPQRRELYASRVKVHPKRVKGSFRRIKWIVMLITLAIYYLAPWIRWDRGPNAPDQAILLDFPGRRFYFFFIEIWPQEVYYVTGLLMLAAFGLFLVTSLAGRVWCGYTCPQTVWTDLFVTVERWVEGDRNARMKLDRAPWTAGKLRKRLVKHAIWIVIAVATGGAWVFYFADAPILALQLATFEAPMIAYLFIAIFTGTTYLLGGLAREQVCTYMCPWPRIQGAMFDEDSLLVSYRPYRGEPRGKHKRGQSWEGRGHCIDCNQCVAVCPMGIDIRDGPQLECIQCALCIDACNSVMRKIELPPGLISYDTYRNLEATVGGSKARLRLLRPRVLIYVALLVVVSAVMLVAFLTRSDLDMTVLRDRNPLFVTLSDGTIRNGYEIKVLNKAHDERRFRLEIVGLEAPVLSAVGQTEASEGALAFTVPADDLRAVKVFVAADAAEAPGGKVSMTFVLREVEGEGVRRAETTFRGPDRGSGQGPGS
jgi:cytochrome c oxidase accessory protein FixG